MRKLAFLTCLTVLGLPALSAQSAQEKDACGQTTACAGCTQEKELPSGESVMDKYIVATGGVEAHKKIKSSVSKGVMEIPAMGMSASLTIYNAEPNLSLTEIEIPGMGKMLDGFDGKIGWSYNAMQGPTIKDGKAAEEAIEEANSRTENWRARYKNAETKGIETVEGEECYKVLLTSRSGKTATHYYSKKTGLLIRTDVTNESPMGEISAELLFKDYKKVGDVLLPHQTVSRMSGQTMAMKISEIRHNVDIPKSTFEPPAEVKALLNK